MNQNINLVDWLWCLQDAMWWEHDLHPDHAILIYKYVHRAYEAGSKYYILNPIGGEVDLTNVYEQFKMLHILKADHE